MPRILLVDDERNVLNSLRRTIHAMAANTFEGETIVETFDKPELALLRAADCEFDLVISDWRMPGMSGLAFLNELVQIQPNIARLVLSGYVDFLSELKAISRIKIFHFISKPWNDTELRLLMRQALEHRQLLNLNQRPSELALRREIRLTELDLQRIEREQPPKPWLRRQTADPLELCG